MAPYSVTSGESAQRGHRTPPDGAQDPGLDVAGADSSPSPALPIPLPGPALEPFGGHRGPPAELALYWEVSRSGMPLSDPIPIDQHYHRDTPSDPCSFRVAARAEGFSDPSGAASDVPSL